LVGFAQNIGKFSGVTSLKSLFTDEIVSAFIEWGLNERGLTRSSLWRLSMLYGAMRHHPKYKDQDYGWFITLFDEVPDDDPSIVQEKKAKKSASYEDLCKIPSAIRAARLSPDDPKTSRLVHDELLMLWLTTLPWRQRNIRECRIGEPRTANVFFAPLPSLVHVAKPKWVEQALKADPKQCFWQFYFREDETKIGQKVRGVLPRRLIALLEEYLAVHRPRLVAKEDPGTLFLNHDGGEVGYQIMTYHISEIVLNHTGRRTTPHLFRDAFAYAFLAAHPEDFLSLSKILWHKTIHYTLSVYGRNFDESNGVRRIDEWLGAAS
jgi:integrase